MHFEGKKQATYGRLELEEILEFPTNLYLGYVDFRF